MARRKIKKAPKKVTCTMCNGTGTLWVKGRFVSFATRCQYCYNGVETSFGRSHREQVPEEHSSKA